MCWQLLGTLANSSRLPNTQFPLLYYRNIHNRKKNQKFISGMNIKKITLRINTKNEYLANKNAKNKRCYLKIIYVEAEINK